MEEVREFLAYTYYLYHVPTGKKYYGCRYANICEPKQDLWNEYFSSSELVKDLIREYGTESFVAEVRKLFETGQEAFEHEQKVLHRIKAVERTDWLNQAYALGPYYNHSIKHSEERIRKNRESHLKLYSDPNYKNPNKGSKRDESAKEKMRKAWETRLPDNEDTRARKKKAKAGVYVGEKNPMYGKPRRDESIEKELETKKRNGTLGVGEKNPMYGRRMKWIYHIETGISKRIDITEVLPEGWLFGMSPVHKENIGNAARNAVRTAESEQKRLATRKKNRMIKLNLLENK